MKSKMLICVLVMLIGAVGGVTEAIPPEAINYQGVLRDSAGNPLDGSFDMVFRYYSADTGGTFYLMEEHLDPAGGGTGQVTVTGGLFNVALGTGELVDVTSGAITSLAEVFTQSDAWLEVQVGAEILSPRIQVRGAGYALNSNRLDGRTADQFLDTFTAQTKTATLVVESSAASSYGVEGRGTSGGGLFEDSDGTGSARVGYGDFGIRASGATYGGYFLDSDSTTYTQLAGGSNGVYTNGDVYSYGTLRGESLSIIGTSNVQQLNVNHSNLFMNYSGPDSDSSIYFYEGSPTGARMFWNDADARFTLSHPLQVSGSVRATSFVDTDGFNTFIDPSDIDISGALSGGLIIGHGSDTDDDYLYFDQQFENLHWNEAGSRFDLSDDLVVAGTLQADGRLNLNHPDLYLNQDGPEGDSSLYFFENGLSNGARLFWNDSQNRFESSHKLRVSDVVRAPVFQDDDNGAYYLDPAASISGLLYGGLIIGHGSGSDSDSIQFDQQAEYLQWNETNTRFEFSDGLALNGPLQAGIPTPSAVAYNRFGTGTPVWNDVQSSSDLFVSDDIEVGGEIALSKVIRMEAQETAGADGDQAIYFYDAGSPTSAYIQWDDVSSITCGTIGTIASGFRWNITDNSDSGWVFGNGTDYEAVIDELGNLEIDGSLHQSGSCDLAETFFGPSDLTAGTVVVLDPDRTEGVRESDRPLDPTVAGVVTTRPGVLLSGPSADAYPVWEELEEIGERLAALPTEPETVLDESGEGHVLSLDNESSDLAAQRRSLKQRAADLEMELDSWARGDVAVALVGRVPVKADASYGPIRKGDFLTTSATPGHARLLDGPGPYLGIAMDVLESGTGDVLVFLSKGWYGGAVHADAETIEEAPAPVIAEVQTMESGLELVLDRDADDRSRFSIHKDGVNGLTSEVFRVDEQGNVFATGSFRPAAMDVAEFHPVSEPVGVGDVLVIDRHRPGHMALGRNAADPAVTGIVSTEPGVLLGSGVQRFADADPEIAIALEIAREAGDRAEEARLWSELERRFTRTHAAIALSGTVPCKVDAGYGSIEVGDLLTVSPTAGHAMRAADPAPQGTVLGKALEPLDAGTGTIQVLVMMR